MPVGAPSHIATVFKHKDKRRIEAKKFAHAFIKHAGNATKAAQDMKELTYDSARTVGMRTLRRADVQEEIRRALEKTDINLEYVLDARKQFVDAGLRQLKGEKGEKESKVSSKDVHNHLQGIEQTISRLDKKDSAKPGGGNSHVHLHLESQSIPEIIQKRNELGSWFTGILDGNTELLEEKEN